MKPRNKFVTIMVVLLVAILILPSIVFVRTEEAVVVRRLGALSHTLTPGPSFLFWPTDTRIRYDLRIREADLIFSAHSTDAQAVRGQVSIQYQLIPANVMDIAEHFGDIGRNDVVMERKAMYDHKQK